MGSLGVIRERERTGPAVHGIVLRIHPWTLWLVIGWVLQVIVRLWSSAHRTFPILVPDETGYLLAARLLSGGATGDLSGRPLYQAGYSLFIAPAYWLSGDPATVYRLVMVINALIGASLLIPAYIALRRMRLSRAQAYLVATVTALLPSGIYYGQFALTDAVLPTVVLIWLLLIHSWIDTGRSGWGVAASVVAAYCSWVHIRGTIIVAVHVGLLVAVLWRRRASRRDVAMSAGALVAVAAAGWALNGWIKSRIYPGGVAPLGDWFFDRLTGLDGWGWTSALAAGKIWYLIIATWGMAGVGLVACGVGAVRRRTPPALRATACVTLAALAGIAIASSAAVPDEGTVANFAYGRYLACLAPVLFLGGGAFALRASRNQAIQALLGAACLALATGGAVYAHAGDRLSRNFFAAYDFPEICFLTWSWNSLRLWFATCAALALLALAALVIGTGRRDGMIIVGVVFAGLCIANCSVVANGVTRYWQGRLESFTSLAGTRLRPEDRVSLDYRGMAWRIWVSHAFQVRTGLRPLDRYHRNTLPADTTLVIVPSDARTPSRKSWPAAPPNWRPISTNTTANEGWVAWRPVR